ncbi:MAG: hypothetical protein ACPLRW_13350 [Moorellales bacterium]
MQRETVYLQGDEAREFARSGYCESCLRPAREWAEPDRYGGLEVHGDYDSRGNLAGFLCPDCAARAGEAREGVALAPIPELTGDLPGDRLMELFRKLGWDGKCRVNPMLVKLHEDDWRELVGQEMDRARGMVSRLGGSELEAAIGVGFLWMNWGPSGGGRMRGMVELHPGWTEEE